MTERTAVGEAVVAAGRARRDRAGMLRDLEALYRAEHEALVGAPSEYAIVARRLAEAVRATDATAVDAQFVGDALGEPSCAG